MWSIMLSQKNNDLMFTISITTLIKIAIIAFTGFTMFANFYPYVTDVDSLFYGVNTLAIAEGNYEFTNDLLKETGKWEFVPVQWTKTIFNTAIPVTAVGFFAFSTSAYLMAGYFGLFYLGPIVTIILLIISERVSTKLFGKFVGLFTVILLSTDFLVYRMGQQLMTDNLFAIFIILGFFYLISFLHNKKIQSILICSVFLSIATFIRPTAIVFFPSEIIILVSYFFFHMYQETKKVSYSKVNNSIQILFFKAITKIKSKKFIKTVILLIIPWLIFMFFFLGYNDYFFGDSSTSYVEVRQNLVEKKDPISTFFNFDFKRFEFIKSYSVSLLPDTIRSILIDVSGTGTGFLTANWLSVFSFIMLGSASLISIYYKKNRVEIFSILVFVISWLLFITSDFLSPSIEHPPNAYLGNRYMIPMLALSFMALGFSISRVIVSPKKKFILNKIRVSKRLKIGIIVLSLFFVMSINDSPQVNHLKSQGFHFKDPFVIADNIQVDKEGLTKNSIIVGGWSARTIEYDAIPLFPYWDWGRYEMNTTKIPQEPIQTIKELMNGGYETFIFKGGVIAKDLIYYKYLEEEHGIIFQNFTKSFCKMELVDNVNIINNEVNLTSDETCFQRVFQPGSNTIFLNNRTINVEIILR